MFLKLPENTEKKNVNENVQQRSQNPLHKDYLLKLKKSKPSKNQFPKT